MQKRIERLLATTPLLCGLIMLLILVTTTSLSNIPTLQAAQISPTPTLPATQVCNRFSSLTVGEQYPPKSAIPADPPLIYFLAMQTSTLTGGSTPNHYGEIAASTKAGRTQPELYLHHTLVGAQFSLPMYQASVAFANTGNAHQTQTLAVNGETTVVSSFDEMHNKQLGGAAITVINTVINNGQPEQGVLIISGKVSSLAIGGEEVWVDDLCFRQQIPTPTPTTAATRRPTKTPTVTPTPKTDPPVPTATTTATSTATVVPTHTPAR